MVRKRSFAAILWLTVLGLEVASGLEAGNRQRTSSVGGLVERATSINLEAILSHQEALELECAKYHTTKMEQVSYLLKYQENNDDQFHLPHPLPVKVPAVCVFLFSHFSRPEPMEVDPSSPSGHKLDFVNWIYNEHEIKPRISGTNTTGSHQVNKRATFEEPAAVLYDYLLDPMANGTSANELDSNEVVQFHRDVQSLMDNKNFPQVIEKNRLRIAERLSPVILVPGLLGSRLQARADKRGRVNIFCSKRSDWQEMWLSLRNMLPLLVDCWLDNVRLELDPMGSFSRPPEGVETRVPDFGSVESVRHLDLKSPKMTRYFAPLIERYTELGYTPDLNLFAAPYDFRLAPQELGGYFEQLKQLVEQVNEGSPSGRPVTLVCHSMGCTHLLVFLRLQSAAWRQARVRKLVAISSPWGGAVKALKALVAGDQLDLPLVSEAKMRKLARSYPSIYFLLPQAEVFGRPSKTNPDGGGPAMVETPTRSYKVADLPQLLMDLGLEQKQVNWYRETTELIRPLEPLADLHVDCIHSLNTPTPQNLVFRNQSDFPNGNYELVLGEGDGTVNYESLLVCADWQRQLPEKVKHKVIMNTNHLGVLSHKITLTHITDDVLTN